MFAPGYWKSPAAQPRETSTSLIGLQPALYLVVAGEQREAPMNSTRRLRAKWAIPAVLAGMLATHIPTDAQTTKPGSEQTKPAPTTPQTQQTKPHTEVPRVEKFTATTVNMNPGA